MIEEMLRGIPMIPRKWWALVLPLFIGVTLLEDFFGFAMWYVIPVNLAAFLYFLHDISTYFARKAPR